MLGFGTVEESTMTDISPKNMKDAPRSGMGNSLEVSEWWSNDACLRGKKRRLEGKWYWK